MRKQFMMHDSSDKLELQVGVTSVVVGVVVAKSLFRKVIVVVNRCG